MSLCRLVVMDFMDGIGRYDEEDGEERYSQSDLKFGVAYAKWLMDDGYQVEPFYGFDLRKFKRWCEQKGRSHGEEDTSEKEESSTRP